MKTMKYIEYNPNMGLLIDVRDKSISNAKPIRYAKNIPYNELIFNHNKYLSKNNIYFIICDGGVKSKKTCNILSVYGYNVVNVIK